MGVLATPPVDRANLPKVYEEARQALAKIERIDECKDWADRSAALAAYGRMAKDNELYETATRIRIWAYRRAGELLALIAPAAGARTDLIGHPTRLQAGGDA